MDFDLNDLLLCQGEPRDLSEPEYLASNDQPNVSTTIIDKGGETYELGSSISSSFFFDANDEKSSHLRHDFVAGKSWGTTDMSLKLLDIDSDLTPDAILVRERRVLELSTTLGRSYETLLSSYNSKRVAYEELLMNNVVNYFILIVGPSHVLTNLRLQQDLVEELCCRCRCAISLERRVEAATGRLLQGDDKEQSREYGRIKKSLKSMEEETYRSDNLFNSHLRHLAKSRVSDDEEDWVAGLVRSSIRKARCKAQGLKVSSEEKNINRDIEMNKEQLRAMPTRLETKRITNFPLAYMKDNRWAQGRFMDRIGENVNCPESLYKLWGSLSAAPLWFDEKQFSYYKSRSRQEAFYNETSGVKHEMRKRAVVCPQLSDSDLTHIALSGPGAKLKSELEEVLNKERLSKISFDPDVDTKDIEAFISSDILTSTIDSSNVDDDILAAILKTKAECHKDAESIPVFNWLRHREITQHASLISDICTELSYEYKTPNKPKEWGFKMLRNQRGILLYKSTSTHIFFSLALNKQDTTIFDTGRLGPSLYETQEYYISDFSSLSEDSLDHFVKALPYTITLQALLAQIFEVPLPSRNVAHPPSYWQTLKTTYLLYLNNKLDAEEIVTSARYLYMNVLQESYKDVSAFSDRLPELLRSRLSAYLLNKIYNLMKYYSSHSVRRTRIREMDGSKRFKLHSVKSIFCQGDISVTQLINSFYYGYVVSKSRGKIGDRNVKVMRKIVTEEFWFLDNIKSKGICLWERRDKAMKHCWDQCLLRYMIDTHLNQMNLVYGGNFTDILERDLLQSFAKCTFSDIATLKASSHSEEEHFTVPDLKEGTTYKELKSHLLDENPSQDGKRPRVITRLFEMLDDYYEDTKDDNPIVIEVAVWCLKQINKAGYFISDCFPKDQHGGDREIHVMYIHARMAQFILERMSRVICGYIPSDSIIFPEYKENFWHAHQKSAQTKLGKHVTVCKSADASKWCQRHHSSKFYLLVARYLPIYMEPFAYVLLYLWTKKRIMIPVDIIANFNKNQNVLSSNTFYKEFKDRYFKATAPFVSTKQRNTIVCESGMWQGILHITSTLLHSILQNFWRSYAQLYLKKMGINSCVDVIQGSDDSAALISISDPRKAAIELCEVLLEAKEELGQYISIWKSEAKSSVGTINLVEYNSEWYIDGSLVKPTARWALACMETTLVEKFVTRMDIYYGTLSQTLESGGTTFLCSLIQMSQSYMHYMLLGLRNHILSDEVLDLIMENHLVSLGYFPLDSDLNAGMTGFDFLMFRTHKLFNVMTHSYDIEELSPSALVEYDEKISKTIRRDINSTYIAFGNFKLWERLLESAKVDSLEDILSNVNENPRMLYLPSRGWKHNKIACSLKLYQPGVKSSISSHQPNIRMMSASAYIASRACMQIPFSKPRERFSLYSLLSQAGSFYNDTKVSALHNIEFPHQDEYLEFNTYLEELLSSYFYQKVDMKRSSKSEILIWGSRLVSEIPLLDICIRGWWKVKAVKISSTMFDSIWRQTKARYSFIKDSCEETCAYTKLNHIELFHFIQTTAKRQRKLKLQDTPNKDTTKESAVTRVYWPTIKLRSPLGRSVGDIKILRHRLFCTLSFAYTSGVKARKAIELLTTNPTLASRFDSLGRAAKRLKVMRDFLVEGDVLLLIQQIETFKRGTVGFFSKRQNTGNQRMGMKYEGEGEWIGKVCGVPCKITMKNQEVTAVSIQRLTDLVELSNSLRTLIREFKLAIPDVPNKSGSNLYLSELGHFESSREVQTRSVAVNIDPLISIEVFDELDNYDWQLKVTKTQLKIVCQHKSAGPSDPEFTVLSDTFTAHDWDPSNPIMPGSDILFTSWQTGSPAPISAMIDATGYEPSEAGLMNLLANLSSEDPSHFGEFDLVSFSNMMKQWLEVTYANKVDLMVREQLEMDARAHEKLSYDEDALQQLYDFEDPLDNIMEELQAQEAADLGDLEIDSEEGSEVLDDAVMDRINSMFFSVEWSYEEEKMRSVILKTAMAKENGFFLNIQQLIEVQHLQTPIQRFLVEPRLQREVVKELKSGPELRFILSWALQTRVPSSYRSSSLLQAQHLTEAEVSMSSFSDDFLITKDQQTLRDTINQLSALLPTVTGLLKDKFNKLIKKYEMELNAVNSIGEHNMLGFISYWHFIDALLSKLKEKQVWDKQMPEVDILTLRTILIAECMDKVMSDSRLGLVSEIERDEMSASAWPEITSAGLLKLLSRGLNIYLNVILNDELIFKHEVPRATHLITLRFRVACVKSHASDEGRGALFGRGEIS